ncbi:hypothetical protein Pcinc_042527 [Petrolisthes cinctipes]|uniref:Uncharacterized protein n=1 Tax=Petrolisthes cinctipes TaxID=88211 RepID=A0AAE1BIL2_PETCI|nr:hypothetical protein Pcinc_042527 [Petrolisthes cinctipes]
MNPVFILTAFWKRVKVLPRSSVAKLRPARRRCSRGTELHTRQGRRRERIHRRVPPRVRRCQGDSYGCVDE